MDVATHPLRMGLSPLALESWLAPQDGDESFLTERANLIATNQQDVIATVDGANRPVAEFAEFLHERDLGQFDHGPAETILQSIGTQIAEDICVLEKDGDAHRLIAAVLCFPNRWKLCDKIERTVTEIHAPVPQYASQISDTVERFLTKLRPLRVFVRDNWGLTTSPTLYQPSLTPPVTVHTLDHSFLRVEEQSFMKLSITRAVIFAIRTIVTPWVDVPQDTQKTVLQALHALSPDWRKYKCVEINGGG